MKKIPFKKITGRVFIKYPALIYLNAAEDAGETIPTNLTLNGIRTRLRFFS